MPISVAVAACAPKPASHYEDSIKVSMPDPSLIVVKGEMRDWSDEDHLHCAAATKARELGVTEMDLVQGRTVVRQGRTELGVRSYFAPRTADTRMPEGVIDEVRGGPMPISAWMKHCAQTTKASG